MSRPSETRPAPQPAVLIVRPPAQAAAEAAAWEAAGWRAVPFSPMRLEPDAQALGTLNERFQKADAVFWVSPGAVETAAPHLVFSDGLPVQIAVGQGTCAALAKFYAGTVACPATGNDSEAVARLPVWNTLASDAEILIVRGHGGRDWLANTLKQRGFRVGTAEVYFRRPIEPDWTVFEGIGPQAAYVTSAEMVRLLFARVPDRFAQALRTLLYFTHHPRIAEALRGAGASRIRITARAAAPEYPIRSDE